MFKGFCRIWRLNGLMWALMCLHEAKSIKRGKKGVFHVGGYYISRKTKEGGRDD